MDAPFFYSKGVFGVDITHFFSGRVTDGTATWYKLIFGNEQVKCKISWDAPVDYFHLFLQCYKRHG